MKIFRLTGDFKMGKNWQNFTKEVLAEDVKDAVERFVSDMGGKHGIKRTQIRVKNTEAMKNEDVENLVLRQMIEHNMVKQ